MKNIAITFFLLTLQALALAESQDTAPFKDPFGDPTAYEFADDEKNDKEFFHLGRFLMVGFDFGLGIYTGGLGRTVNPGAYVGGRIVYFFDKSIAFEAAAHWSNQLDVVRSNSLNADINTTLIPLTLGFRYYFDAAKAPKAIAIANPYVAFGGGAYLRQQEVTAAQPSFSISQANNSQFGAYAAVGGEFAVYRRHLYLGVDLRYHLIFFFDEDETLGGAVSPGDRGGDYFSPVVTVTYSF